ncbi:MAG TPA: beta-hexosaminidase [Candidatus Faecousia faecavium]|nr:beta-hexosaminidase [Candidatus Faecousia faecavium]
MKRFAFLLSLLLLCGCAAQEAAQTSVSTVAPTAAPTTPPTTAPTQRAPTEPEDPIRLMLNQMSLEERVGQLFLARCDANTAVTDLQTYHLGGFVLFAQDFEGQTPDSLREKLTSYQSTAKIPMLIAVDEEGGTVTRVSRYSAFRASPFLSPREYFAQGGMELVVQAEEEKSQLLHDLGISVNLGPVCDLADDPQAFMYQRSMGSDIQTVSDFVTSTVQIMGENSIGSALKHFPGYGNNTDTHTGMAVDSRTLDELAQRDLLPFAAGIQAGCDAILVSHTIVEAFDPSLPASLSPAVHQYLREDMGFSGVILTDDLVMQAITDTYGAGEAAVMAVLAGNDLLCSTEYATQYQAVLDAVLEGRIDIDVLNQAVRHVLQWKIDLGLLNLEAWLQAAK